MVALPIYKLFAIICHNDNIYIRDCQGVFVYILKRQPIDRQRVREDRKKNLYRGDIYRVEIEPVTLRGLILKHCEKNHK